MTATSFFVWRPAPLSTPPHFLLPSLVSASPLLLSGPSLPQANLSQRPDFSLTTFQSSSSTALTRNSSCSSLFDGPPDFVLAFLAVPQHLTHRVADAKVIFPFASPSLIDSSFIITGLSALVRVWRGRLTDRTCSSPFPCTFLNSFTCSLVCLMEAANSST